MGIWKMCRVLAVMMAVLLVMGIVDVWALPVREVSAEGRVDGAGMTISAGFNHSFAILPDNSLWAWGGNHGGALGDGTFTARHNPVHVMENVSAVSAGFVYTMAIRSDHSLWTWGTNLFGQFGNGTTSNQLYPTPIRVMENVAAVYALRNAGPHTMAIRTDGSLWAWGSNSHGQLGDGTIIDRLRPVHVMENVAAISTGGALGSFTMAIRTDGSLWAWGSNSIGELGDGSRIDRHRPVHIKDNILAVSAGSSHTMAIGTDGSLWTWGNNWDGQLGDGTTTPRVNPVRIMENVAAVSAGTGHAVAIRTDGSMWTWGANSYGQLGDGTTANRSNPVQIMDNVLAISAGSFHNNGY